MPETSFISPFSLHPSVNHPVTDCIVIIIYLLWIVTTCQKKKKKKTRTLYLEP
jgi:hypothetical protein